MGLAMALVIGAAPAGGQTGQGGQARIDILRRTSSAQADSIERHQVRRLQRQLDSLFRLVGSSDEMSAPERRRIEAELSRTAERINDLVARLDEPGDRVIRLRGGIAPMGSERSASAMSRALMQVDELPAEASGWMGIVVEGSGYLPRIENGELIVRYASYPEILSVDPSSPAQRAGLAPRDTVISYDGRDVREDISYTRLLRPNARVIVRVRRDGRPRDIPVTVAAAPQRIALRRGELDRDKGSYVIRLPEAPSFPRSGGTPPVQSGTMRASTMRQAAQGGVAMPAAPTAAPGPMAPAARTGFMFGFGNTGVAGASLATITDGLARALGVTSGVLVTAVPVGSPAHESGLADGDVITKVAGQAVRSVAQVRQLVAMAWEDGDRAVEMEIVRGKKVQRATLRW